MLSATSKIGQSVLKGNRQKFIKTIIKELEPVVKGKQMHLLKINLDPDKAEIQFDIEQISSDTAEKFCWIGNADGPNSRQRNFTTNNLQYLLSQTLPNWIGIFNEVKSNKIRKTLEKFYFSTSKIKGGYVIDLQKCGIIKESMNEYLDKFKTDEKGLIEKKYYQTIEDDFLKGVNQRVHINKNEISLYNLTIGDWDLVHDPDYITNIVSEKLDSTFSGIKGYCSLCGKEGRITTDTSKFKFKYYNTDKKSFSSYLTGDFSSNFQVCSDCYMNIIVGEQWIDSNMQSRIGQDLTVYMIPELLFDEMDLSYSDELKYIRDDFQQVVTMEKEVIYELRDRYDQNFLLNILFYRKNKQQFKILKLIQDVPMPRIKVIQKAFNDSKIGDIRLSLNGIYGIFPLRIFKGSEVEYKKLLDLYDSIFSGKRVNIDFLMDKFIELIRIHRFSGYGRFTNIIDHGDPDISMIYDVIKCNILLNFLTKLGLGREVEYMEIPEIKELKGIGTYITDMNYTVEQAALFLLGTLVAEVAGSQRKNGYTNKPILEKINYSGMSQYRVMRLANDIMGKMREQKILEYNEMTYGIFKNLLDRSITNWTLNDQENVFYILSGYAFKTYENIKNAIKKEDKVNHEQQ